MPDKWIDLLDDLHKTQKRLDFMITSLALLYSSPEEESPRLRHDQAYEVAAFIREMVDKMFKRVEEEIREFMILKN